MLFLSCWRSYCPWVKCFVFVHFFLCAMNFSCNKLVQTPARSISCFMYQFCSAPFFKILIIFTNKQNSDCIASNAKCPIGRIIYWKVGQAKQNSNLICNYPRQSHYMYKYSVEYFHPMQRKVHQKTYSCNSSRGIILSKVSWG
jgi:hypothetical protein